MSVATSALVTGVAPPFGMVETSDPLAGADTGSVYTKDVSGRTELFYEDDTGAKIQLTSGGSISGGALPPPWVTESASAASIRNGTNACTFSVYNTYTAGTPDYERLTLDWSANVARIGMSKNGTGSNRAMQLLYPGTTAAAITFNTNGVVNGIDLASASTGSAGYGVKLNTGLSATSGTPIVLQMDSTLSDGGTNSTTSARVISLTPIVNYTGGSKTGKVNIVYLNPTLTSQPTGNNGGIVFSSAFTSSTFPAMRFFNTADEDTNPEYAEIGWHAVSNTFVLRTNKAGSGSARALALNYNGSTNVALQVPAGASGTVDIGGFTNAAALSTGRLAVGRGWTTTATSGTNVEFLVNASPLPTSTSTMAYYSVQISPTINYSNGTPGAGYVYGLYIAPVNTALPTGRSAGIALSSTASGLTGAIVLNNQADEQTNYEQGILTWSSNTLLLSSVAGGTGTVRDITMTVANAAGSAVIKHVATSTITGGVTDGYTASLRLSPTYTAGSAQTVTRHNYMDINQVALTGAGPAACTDACVFRFDAAAGTHKAVDAGTTKTSPGTVTQWVKINVNGTLAYIPSYSSKTS